MAFDDLFDDAAIPFAPLEDLLLALLRPLEEYIPGLKIGSWLDEKTKFPFVLVRREPGAYANTNTSEFDPRWADRTIVQVDCLVEGPDPDTTDAKAAKLSDIIRRRLLTARLRSEVVPGLGWLNDFRVLSPPRYATDWATSTGVVQYASLPAGVIRYEAKYGVLYRPDIQNPVDPLELLQ